jgi:hypothetical protein
MPSGTYIINNIKLFISHQLLTNGGSGTHEIDILRSTVKLGSRALEGSARFELAF